jgi:hypothetical protein
VCSRKVLFAQAKAEVIYTNQLNILNYTNARDVLDLLVKLRLAYYHMFTCTNTTPWFSTLCWTWLAFVLLVIVVRTSLSGAPGRRVRKGPIDVALPLRTTQ